MELIKYNKAKFERNKLIIDGSINIDEWKELGQSLKQVEGSVQFWIGDWAMFGDEKGFTGKYVNGKVYDELEEITGLDRKTLQNYKHVADKIPSSLRREDLDYSHFKEVTQLPEEKQIEFINRAGDEGLTVRELREEIKKDAKNYETKELPEGVFDIIYCDPPWQYDFAETDNRKIENQYPTMSVDEICEMNLPQIADNALLLMWATAPKLIEALKVITAWGFIYKTHSIWDKGKIGMGYWFRGQHELLLVATKGSFAPPEPGFRYSSVYKEDRNGHSQKPVFYYEWIEQAFAGNKIELFARTKRNEWEAWGNEPI